MKRLIISLLAFAFLLNVSSVFAQMGHGGEPVSFRNADLLSTYVDHIQLAKPDMAQIEAEDAQSTKDGSRYMIGRFIDVNRNINDAGTWDELPNGARVWRLRISAPDANALSVFYDKFYLPKGTQLFLYNQNHKQLIGSLDYRNNNRFSEMYSTEIIEGETTWLELIIYPEATEMPILEIGEVCYIYRGVSPLIGRYMDIKPPDFGSSESCEVNVNCPEGANWQTEKKGVAVIFCDGALCSGTVVNNTSNDGTPYFLTADHCGGGSTTISQWQFYFNFEASGCTNPGSAPAYNTITGAVRRARADIEAGKSDFLLLELNCTEDDLANVNAYYNGWDRSTTGSPSGVSIHHPSGDIKKISTYETTLVSGTFNSCPANAHWRADWVATATNTGVTEGGSSGSPLFNNNKLVVGTLSGGLSYCGCPVSSRNDLYGKFDYHWESNGTTDDVKLKPWLDPTNTGSTTCPGRAPNSGAAGITAQFIANPTNVTTGGTVAFTDQSTGNPTSWSWTFEGGTPGTSTTQNPTVNYPTAGTYSVTLTVSDGTDNDTEVKSGYIIVSGTASGLNAAFGASSYSIFEGECINFQDQSTGNPTSWEWNFQGAETLTSTDQNPVNICYMTAGTYNVSLTVQNGTDTDTENCVGCITVEVNPVNPIANFSGSPLIIPVGGVVHFTNLCENGPFDAFAWTFEGGIPGVWNDSVPQPIMYNEVGFYDVELRCRNMAGVQDIELKENYIQVIPAAVEPPTANFVANYTVIQPGDAVNFIDLSSGFPYQWEWTFQGGDPATSVIQNPEGIVFAAPGIYDICLIVYNNEGSDTLCREDYIVVSATDPCTQAPEARFKAAPRLITQGQRVYFQDESTNLPQYWNWVFDGGNPATGVEGSITGGVLYSVPGIYDVTLAVNNACGSDMLTKDDYIYVFSGPVSLYCDTLSNLRNNEGIGLVIPNLYWGFLAGHNGKRIKSYADKFSDFTFGEVKSLIVPVEKAVYGNYNAYVRFMIWEGSNDTIGEVLGEKKMYIRDLQENYNNVITFDEPVEINGPFWAGFRINYDDVNQDGYSDDLFVVSIANPRGEIESYNTMWVLDGSTWKSNVEVFGFATSTAIRPLGCLVDVPDYMFDGKLDVYPNPANDIITLSFGTEFTGKDINIQIRNILGNTVAEIPVSGVSGELNIPVSGYADGMYLVSILVDGKILTRRVSVMH